MAEETKAVDTLEEMAAAARASGDIEPLLERIRLAEAVIDAAKGPESIARTVVAIAAYETRYGDVPITYTPDWR
jgi:hypothetical protein